MDDDFKLTSLNKILITLTISLVIIFIVSLIYLIFTLNKEEQKIPNLNVIKEKTSTKYLYTTASETTTTNTTTTTRALVSPYYDVNVSSLMNDEILKNRNLTKEDAQAILEKYYNLLNSIYDINEYSFLDIKTTVEYAKNGEIDKIEKNGYKYGIIYNGEELFKIIMNGTSRVKLFSSKYNDIPIFIEENDNYYRIYGLDINSKMVFVSLTLDSWSNTSIVGTVKYYDSMYKEQGYTAPQYKTVNLKLKYNKNWMVYEYNYPFYS